MASRNRRRTSSSQPKPIVRADQLEAFETAMLRALGALSARLDVTEQALSSVIRDIYADVTPDDDEPCVDCEDEDYVPGDTEGSAEARARHLEKLPQVAGLGALPGAEEDDDAWAAEEAARLRAEAQAMAEADWVNEGGR